MRQINVVTIRINFQLTFCLFALMCKSEAFRRLELTNNFVFFVTSFKNYLVLCLVCLFLSISPMYIQELGKTWEDIQNEIEEEEETRSDGNADEE